MDSVQFSKIMRLPHRRFAFAINAPAVVRHIVYRPEDGPDVPANNATDPLTATSQTEYDNRRNTLIENINKRLVAIQIRCFVAEPTTFALEGHPTSATRIHRTRTLTQTLLGIPGLEDWRVRLRIDILNEYFAVTFVLDQRVPEGSHATICDLERALCPTNSSSRHHAATRPADPQQFSRLCYEHPWDAIRSHIGEELEALPGRRFCEFRGAALRQIDSPLCKRDGPSRVADNLFMIPQLDAKKIEESRTTMRQWVAHNEMFLNEIMQLKLAAGENDRESNCVLSELVDGMAVYASSVRPNQIADTGPHAVAGRDNVVSEEPLRYLILYNGLSRYQLGRIIRVINQLGELRCAAVLDVEKIIQASSDIRSLGNRIDACFSSDHDAPTLSDGELAVAQRELNRIAVSRIPGGLLHRINRSRLYANTFRKRMKDVRAQRLEGWQSYDAFFRRNLYPTFDHIDLIGTRYTALADRITRLTIARNNAANREIVTKIEKLVATIVSIQEFADVIGICAFTYYGGRVLVSIAELPVFLPYIEPAFGSHNPHNGLEGAGHVLALLIALVGWMFVRHRRETRQREARPEEAGSD